MADELVVKGLDKVQAFLDPKRFYHAWGMGLRAGARLARDKVREEASQHQRYRGKMAKHPTYVIEPKHAHSLEEHAIVHPGRGGDGSSGRDAPQLYVLAYGHKSKVFPRVDALAAWLAFRNADVSETTGRRLYGRGGRKARIADSKRAAFLVGRAIQARGFNLGGRGAKTDNYWWRAINGGTKAAVTMSVHEAMNADLRGELNA